MKCIPGKSRRLPTCPWQCALPLLKYVDQLSPSRALVACFVIFFPVNCSTLFYIILHYSTMFASPGQLCMVMPNVLRNNDEPIRTQTDNHRKAMIFLRVFSSLRTAGGIYVCGGFNGTSSTRRAEFLDLQVASRTPGLGCRKLDLTRGPPKSKGIQNRCAGLTVQFPVWWCFWTITLPFIGSSRASKGEASRQPNTLVLKHILAPAAGSELYKRSVDVG